MSEKIFIEIDEESASIKGFEDEVKELLNENSFHIIERKRVSHIVPENLLLRTVFRLIRSIISDDSRIADWTRRWKCSWIVVIDKKKYGPFKDRKKAIEFEKYKLKKEIENGKNSIFP